MACVPAPASTAIRVRCLSAFIASPPSQSADQVASPAIPIAPLPTKPVVDPERARKYDRIMDTHLAALSALGSHALQQRRAGVVPVEVYDDGGKPLSTPIAAAVDSAGSLSTDTAAQSLGFHTESGKSSAAPPWTTLTGLFVRESFVILSTQLVKAVLPAQLIEKKDPVLASLAINDKVGRGDGLAALAMGLCYVDGLGKFTRDRQKAKEIFQKLREQLPKFPWPKLCYALLLLLEAQERALFRKAGDLSVAPADLRLHPDCQAAVKLLTSCWEDDKLAPVPMILARCHLYSVGTSSGTSTNGPSPVSASGEPLGENGLPLNQWNALQWLSKGAAAGDPYCCAEVAKYLIWVRESAAARKGKPTSTTTTTTVVDDEEQAAIIACLRYAAVCDNTWAREKLASEYRRAGMEDRAKLWWEDDKGTTHTSPAAGAATSTTSRSVPPPPPMTLLSGLNAAAGKN
jgi:hypothetical protein